MELIEKIERIPYIDFGGEGQLVHFAHANGYPPESYRQLAEVLSTDHQVVGMLQKPLWGNDNFSDIKTWHSLADDMIRFLDENNMSQVVGVGHSLGAVVSVLASHKRPDLFKQLFLIEPVIFPKAMTTINHLLPMWLRKKYVPVCKIALARKDHWEDRRELFDSYRNKKVFRRLSDEALQDWIDAGTVSDESGGITLRFTKEWEAHMYATVTNVLSEIKNSSIPIHVMRGERTDVISDRIWKKLRQQLGEERCENFSDAGHLLPMERPVAVGKWISDKIDLI